MRIAILMSLKSPWSKMIVSELVAGGHEIVLCYPEDRAPPPAPALDDLVPGTVVLAAFPLPMNWAGNAGGLAHARALGRWCSDQGCDILLTLYGGWFSAIAWLSGFRPFSVYIVGSDILLAKGIKRWILGRILRRASHVFANGIALGQATAAASGRQDVCPLYHGIETGEDPFQEPRPDTIEIICSRWFEPIYNNALLIRAVSRLPDALPDYSLTFLAGGGQLEAAKTLADNLLSPKTRRRVTFLGGVSHAELLERYRKAHIYASVSNSDGTSTSLLEAFAAGLFPIVTDIPANTEWVKSELCNGIIVPSDDADALARALERAILDTELRQQGARLNRISVIKHGDIRANMTKMTQLLSEKSQ